MFFVDVLTIVLLFVTGIFFWNIYDKINARNPRKWRKNMRLNKKICALFLAVVLSVSFSLQPAFATSNADDDSQEVVSELSLQEENLTGEDLEDEIIEDETLSEEESSELDELGDESFDVDESEDTDENIDDTLNEEESENLDEVADETQNQEESAKLDEVKEEIVEESQSEILEDGVQAIAQGATREMEVASFFSMAPRSEEVDYPFEINGMDVTSANISTFSGVSYTPGAVSMPGGLTAEGTLVLNAVDLTSLDVEGTLKVSVVGENQIYAGLNVDGAMQIAGANSETDKLIVTSGSTSNGITGTLSGVSNVTLDVKSFTMSAITGSISHVSNAKIIASTTSTSVNSHAIDGAISHVSCSTITATAQAGSGINGSVSGVSGGSITARGALYGIKGSVSTIGCTTVISQGETAAVEGSGSLYEGYKMQSSTDGGVTLSDATVATGHKYLKISYPDCTDPCGGSATPPTITVSVGDADDITELYDGASLENSQIIGTVVDSNGNGVDGSWVFVDTAPKNVVRDSSGNAIAVQVEVQFVPTDSSKYDMTASTLKTIINVKIDPVVITVTAQNKDINVGDPIPSSFDITYSNDWKSPDTEQSIVTTKAVAGVDPTLTTNVPSLNNVIDFKTKASTTSPNYDFIYIQGILNINEVKPTLSPLSISAQDLTIPYDGATIEDEVIKASIKDSDGNSVAGTWEFVNSPKDTIRDVNGVVISKEHVIKFVPQYPEKYVISEELTATINVTVIPLKFEVTPNPVRTEINAGEAMPSYSVTYKRVSYAGEPVYPTDPTWLMAEPKSEVVLRDPIYTARTLTNSNLLNTNTAGTYNVLMYQGVTFTTGYGINPNNYEFVFKPAVLVINAVTPPVNPPVVNPTIVPTTPNDIVVEYDGENLENSQISGTVTDSNGDTVDGTWVFVTPPKDVDDSGDITVTFVPDDDIYESFTTTVDVTINPVQITVSTQDKEMFAGDSVPSFEVFYSNNWKGSDTQDNIVLEDAIFSAKVDGTVVSNNNPVSVDTRVVSSSSNYTFVYEEGNLVILEAEETPVNPEEEEGGTGGGVDPETLPPITDATVEITPEGGVNIDTNRPDEVPEEVRVNEETIEPSLYEVEDGIVSITPQALENLNDGENSIEVVFDDGVVETVVIADEGTPLNAYVVSGSWSLFDLIMSVIGILLSILYLVIRPKKTEEEMRYIQEDDTSNNKRILTSIALITLALFNVVLLIITQNFTMHMSIFDIWSIVFAVVVVIQAVLMFFLRKKDENSDVDANYKVE